MRIEGIDQRASKARSDRWTHTIVWIVLFLLSPFALSYCTRDSDSDANDASGEPLIDVAR